MGQTIVYITQYTELLVRYNFFVFKNFLVFRVWKFFKTVKQQMENSFTYYENI